MKKIHNYIRSKLGPSGFKGFSKTKFHILSRKVLFSHSKEIPNISKSDKSKEYGIFFIAFEKKYVDEAIYCAQSIREVSDIGIAICCDKIRNDARYCFDNVNLINPNHIRAKVDYLNQTPFEYTLYLDSDTKVTEDISYIFDILDKYDMAFTHDFARKRQRWCKLLPEYDEIPEGFSELGGGVILYKRSKALEFIELWKHYFYKYFNKTNGWDQASLRIAAWKSSCNMYILPPEFNVRSVLNRLKSDTLPDREGGLHPLRPRILHWHGLNDSQCDVKPYKY